MKYCEKCKKEVQWKVVNEKVKSTINDKDIIIQCDVPRCSECGEELNDNDLFEKNSKIAREKYITQYNVITIDDIKGILDRLSISDIELSEKLGWSKLTITKYLAGKLPTVEHSNKLREL